MKAFYTYSLLAISLVLAWSCSEEKDQLDAAEIPELVMTSFNNSFADATEMEWKMEDENYEVEFLKNDLEYEALFSPEGEMLEVEVEVDLDALPAEISAYINQKYASAKIEEAAKVMNSEGNFYEIEVEFEGEEIDIWFTPEGEFVKNEGEANAETEEDEE